jgi:hypothetical protein
MMPRNGKTASLAAEVLLLSGLWLGMCADARAESTTTPKQRAYPQVQDLPAQPDKSAMTPDEQSKLKKELIDARDRRTFKAGGSAARPKTKKPQESKTPCRRRSHRKRNRQRRASYARRLRR